MTSITSITTASIILCWIIRLPILRITRPPLLISESVSRSYKNKILKKHASLDEEFQRAMLLK